MKKLNAFTLGKELFHSFFVPFHETGQAQSPFVKRISMNLLRKTLNLVKRNTFPLEAYNMFGFVSYGFIFNIRIYGESPIESGSGLMPL